MTEPAEALATRYRIVAGLRFVAVATGCAVALAILLARAGSDHWLACLVVALAQGGGWVIGSVYEPLRTGLFAALPPEGEEPRPARGASWAGALTGAALASLAAALAFPASGTPGGGLAPLLAFAVSANAAYVPAKLACLVWGCCRSRERSGFPGGLPGLEMALSLAILAASLALVAAHPAAAAALAASAHAALRAYAAHRRGLGRGAGWPLSDPGFEIFTLAAIAAAALLIA